MNKVAIGFLTKDRPELTRRTIEPLLKAMPGKFDLWWFDGSREPEGLQLVAEYAEFGEGLHVHTNIHGGADTAVAYALSTMAAAGYEYIGLHENDVLLTSDDWFDRTMDLFRNDVLSVGAASARCYEERILIQRNGYAVMHNLGFGQQIMTRKAAYIALENFRTGYTHANRLLFSHLSGVDIGGFWAFRGGQHLITADWHQDAVLAAHGLASVALVPSPVEMIGQVPPLAEQGLTIARQPIDRAEGFEKYEGNLKALQAGDMEPAFSALFHAPEAGNTTVFPHQVPYLDGDYDGEWTLRWSQGWGPFAWRAGTATDGVRPVLEVPVLGPCNVLISGGPAGGEFRIEDPASGFSAEPEVYPESAEHQVLAVPVPSAAAYRSLRLTALSPGVCFFGLQCRERQPRFKDLRFTHSWLPPTG